MDHVQTQRLVVQLAAGFETLEGEYQKLFRQQQAMERKLATAREQYNELAKLCGAGNLYTPPLSLSSNPPSPNHDTAHTVLDMIGQKFDKTSKEAVRKIREGISAAEALQRGLPTDTSGPSVKIWLGPSADRVEASSALMPSISESPLEQDFTIEGKPSKLGCPFASMANQKLSSHAASVLSRYNTRDGTGASQSSVGRINGRDSLSQRQSRQASMVDPIKAEICGLSDHHQQTSEMLTGEEGAMQQHTEANADVGVCPIRFLDQHSPEEVATYFEKHKHEVPRSHEVCVRRYQSNEQQIKQLDAKYGNLVSMIQGLGEKHKGYLPEDPDPDEAAAPSVGGDGSHEKIQQWASSVSAQAVDGQEHRETEEERQAHFERPLRDIRVGESPSRPWGISVPAKYLGRNRGSDASSIPAMVGQTPSSGPAVPGGRGKTIEGVPARCPFGFDKLPNEEPAEAQEAEEKDTHRPSPQTQPPAVPTPAPAPAQTQAQAQAQGRTQTQTQTSAKQPVFVAAQQDYKPSSPKDLPAHSGLVFNNCPVFIGYSVEDATRILRDSGFHA